jgi:hypothetical protein
MKESCEDINDNKKIITTKVSNLKSDKNLKKDKDKIKNNNDNDMSDSKHMSDDDEENE